MWKLTLCCISFIYSVLATSIEKDASLIDGRILGGHEVAITEYPYQSSVQYEGTHRCGGAIIGRAWIITAAHCFDTSPTYPSRYTVRVGTSFFNMGGQVIDVLYIATHPSYSNVTQDYDIALVRLLGAVSLSESAEIIQLPMNVGIDIERKHGRVTGWGSTWEGGRPTDVLQAVDLLVMPELTCEEIYPDRITQRTICAGMFMGGAGVCVGDDGDPFVMNSELVGIVSWRSGCGAPLEPAVFTNVAVMRDWITQITGI